MKRNYILPVCYTVKVHGEDALADGPELTMGSKQEEGMEILTKEEMEEECVAGEGSTAPTPTNIWDSVW